MIRGSVWLPARGDQSLFEPCTQASSPEALAFSGTSVVSGAMSHASQWIQQDVYKRQLQDFIPGGDDAIRTLTTFSDASGEVRVVSGGVVCLQDHDPTALGNPLCIMGEREPEIIACAKRFLKRTGYRGFANFDIKLDERDGSFRFFEVNTRCGRNTYYMSLGGQNFVELIVREFLLGETIDYREAYDPFVYSCVPRYVLDRSMENRARLQQALETLRRTPEPYPCLLYTSRRPPGPLSRCR